MPFIIYKAFQLLCYKFADSKNEQTKGSQILVTIFQLAY